MQIYVLPTVEGQPPQAILATAMAITPEGIAVLGGSEVHWSSDTGAWVAEGGIPVPNEVGEAITAHAKELGVEW